MSALLSLPLPTLWAQAFLSGVPERYRALMGWLFVFGEPNFTIPGNTLGTALLAGLITWLKVIGLFCLLGWVVSWVSTAIKERAVKRVGWLDVAALGALVGVVITMGVLQMETTGKIPVYKIAGVYLVNLLTIACATVLFAWVETNLWGIVRRLGKRADLLVLFGMHVALVVGILFGLEMRQAANTMLAGTVQQQSVTWWDGLIYGVRISGTYMGYVVLMRVAWQVLGEVSGVRFRRLYAIARVTIAEANRRMWAPYVVITVFGVILAFTHWFLQPPRPAEMGRLFVGTLLLLCSLLLTVMITLLTPLSLPQDIQNQTIYTVVSKPVRRIELIWGRMLGFMTIVTGLVLIFGVISLFYLDRNVGGKIKEVEAQAVAASAKGRLAEYTLLRDQAEQLGNRMTARVPVYGSLTFLDSRGTPHSRGIDVGQEQSMREPRSHIEGGTPASAIWAFGVVPDPMAPPGVQPILLDRRIPVSSFLKAGTVEALLDRVYELRMGIASAEQEQKQPNVQAARAQQLGAAVTRAQGELKTAAESLDKLKAEDASYLAKAEAADAAKQANEAAEFRAQSARLHSPPVTLEMTFNIYRTTKGRVGEAVYAELEATNPHTGAKSPRDLFAIREYYTNKRTIPAELLAGSNGDLRIEVQCISPTQYLGMAQSDLFLLATEGNFGTNFMKGLFGVWLQAMVLTAIGVFAGTFLSWPVALLTTIAFFVAGQVAFAFLLDFTRQSLMGGGPFESLIRLLTHDNQMSDLTPTFAVVTAKTMDALVMPIMSRLVYIVPNFASLDVTNDVANGFAVTWPLLFGNTLLAFAYAVPFSIAGYFILKNREVAA